MDFSPLIPDIPLSPVNKDQSSSDEDFPAEQSTPANKRPTKVDRIHLEKDTYNKVRGHADTLKALQSKVIALIQEISQVDNAQSVPYQLRVRRDPPRLPGQLNHSEEFTDSWNSVLQRAGRKLCRVWREELSRHAKRHRERFLERNLERNPT